MKEEIIVGTTAQQTTHEPNGALGSVFTEHGVEVRIDWNLLAGHMYGSYGDYVEWKDRNGNTIRPWTEMSEELRNGWLEATGQAVRTYFSLISEDLKGSPRIQKVDVFAVIIATFNGYCNAVYGKNFDGESIPSYWELPEKIREAWAKAAMDVIAEISSAVSSLSESVIAGLAAIRALPEKQ